MAWLSRNAMHGGAFGIIEATIMMLGVMLGLSVTHDKSIIILGIVAAGVADAVANSSAFHVAEEAEGGHTQKEVWRATLMTFLGTVLPVVLLIVPLILFPLNKGIITSAVFGVIIISWIGNYVAKKSKKDRMRIIAEYLVMAVIAVIVTYIAGRIVQYAGI